MRNDSNQVLGKNFPWRLHVNQNDEDDHASATNRGDRIRNNAAAFRTKFLPQISLSDVVTIERNKETKVQFQSLF